MSTTARDKAWDEPFRLFIDSFNGDEAGEIEHVADLYGNSGFVMTGGKETTP